MASTGNKTEFFRLIDAMLDRESALRIRYAYRFAKDVHRNQQRKSAPDGDFRYFVHPREVAQISMQHSMDPNLIIGCLLHDVLEDGDDPRDAEEIEHFLGTDVLKLVRSVSKTPKDGFHERFSRYSDWRARWVKACDRLHNLRTLPPDNLPFREKQLAETRDRYLHLFDAMGDMAPPEFRRGAFALAHDIRSACDTLARSTP